MWVLKAVMVCYALAGCMSVTPDHENPKPNAFHVAHATEEACTAGVLDVLAKEARYAGLVIMFVQTECEEVT